MARALTDVRQTLELVQTPFEEAGRETLCRRSHCILRVQLLWEAIVAAEEGCARHAGDPCSDAATASLLVRFRLPNLFLMCCVFRSNPPPVHHSIIILRRPNLPGPFPASQTAQFAPAAFPPTTLPFR